MPVVSEMQRINRIIIQGAKTKGDMTELQFFAAEIKEWKDSKRRKEQIAGEQYYNGQQDILHRRRTMIGEDGKLQEVDNLPNNQTIDNQFSLMVDQKTNYLVGKPFTINCENKQYVEQLNKVFDRRFRRLLKYVCEDALTTGIGWVYPYYDAQGELNFKHFPAYEILPFWADDDHTMLDCAVRLYPQEVWEGGFKKIIEKVEIYRTDGIYRYIYDNDMLMPDTYIGEHDDYFIADDDAFNWTRIPLIPFKYNKQEMPLLNRVKCLQDAINELLSDFENNMQEDARNTILIIKNYDGEDLGQFRHNLAAYGVVKVSGDGDVTKLTVEVNSDNYKAILDLLKKALIKNARGYDATDDRMSNNPNQMNIQSMYSDIDLDANGMETEFQAAFDDLLWFINSHLHNVNMGDFSDDISIVFNRDVLINESESIENCVKLIGLLSTESIIEQLPWTIDVELEMERLKKEKQEAMNEYADAFPIQKNQQAGDAE